MLQGTFNFAGELSTVNYSGSASNLSFSSDRRGRQTTIVQGNITTSKSYDDAGNMLSESYSGGPLSGISVNSGFDQFLRRTNLSVQLGGSTLVQQSFGFDAASRMNKIGNGTVTAGYAYLANSRQVSQVSFTNNGVQRMVTTKQFDYLHRLQSIGSASSSNIASFAYRYNSANQRTSVTNLDGSSWNFGYDFLGQVVSGKKYWADGWPVAGQQFQYAFDDIGNRTTAASGGDQWGANLRYSAYSANSRNQYTSRSNPGFTQVLGTAGSNALVSISADSGASATVSRHADYFRGELPVNNASGPVWLTVTNLASVRNGSSADYAATNVGNLFVPPATEGFGYDADGNMTNDGRWTITWDAENRATSFTTVSSLPTAAKKKVECTFDSNWRRIQKVVYTNSGSGYVAQSTNRFVYDGWNVIAILDGANALLYSFTWGLDASGTRQGAGGVGGLQSMTVHTGPSAGTYLYVYDGNFNVTALVNAADGSVAARYEYGPFTEALRASGPMAKVNPFLFSTKYQDEETSLLYYGYRYYNTGTGRWLSRDPINEKGDANLYSFVRNDVVNRLDRCGLAGWVWGQATTTDDDFISYDPAMTIRPYRAPTSYRSGTWAAEFYSEYRRGLNYTLFNHYLHGGGTFSLTSEPVIKDEVVHALTPKIDKAEDDIKKQVESSKCPGNYLLPGNLSVSFFGDSGFTAIDRTPFKSSVWAIGRANAGLSKHCFAIVFCACDRPIVALMMCDLHMYFYDQFADAADVNHTQSGAQEWAGGTQFDETGAWGRSVTQSATYQ